MILPFYTGRCGGPWHVTDANGVEIRDVDWCDTDTGECRIVLRNDKGHFYVVEPGETVARERRLFPAPLTATLIDPDEETVDVPCIVNA